MPAVALAVTGGMAVADEGGVSFWLPGQYASFAAIAPSPGFSLPMQSYYYSGSAGASKALDRGGNLSFGLDTDFFGQFIVPRLCCAKGVKPGLPLSPDALIPRAL